MWPSLPLGWSSLAPWPRFYWSLPLGIVASGDALLPCLCAWSVVAHYLPSSLCLMATKASGPVWGFFPLHHASCVVGELCAPCVSTLSLSTAASWLLSSRLLCGLWCCVCSALAAPLPLLPPPDGRSFAGWLRVVCFLFCEDTWDTALHNSSVVSPWLHRSHLQ